MESRLWKLSGGDIIEVSSVMGHTPGVADNHYLKINDEIKVDGATFVGEAFPGQTTWHQRYTYSSRRLQDSLYGSLAPKDGVNHCSEFIHCLGCPSYAIVGTLRTYTGCSATNNSCMQKSNTFSRTSGRHGASVSLTIFD
jgi:hypothetical protein